MFYKDLDNIRTRFKAMWADLHHATINRVSERERQDMLSELRTLTTDLTKAVDKRRTRSYTENTPEMVEFIGDVVGAIEADTFTYHTLWKENRSADGRKLTWETPRSEMSSVIVGQIEDRPVNVQLRIAVVGGARLLFYHGCSTVVDHDMIRNFLDIALPASARDATGGFRPTDGDTFYSVLPRDGTIDPKLVPAA